MLLEASMSSEIAVKAYTRIASTGIRTIMVSVSTILALIWCISKIVAKYRKGLESEKGIDYKAMMDLIQPLIPYILFILLFPTVISIIEVILSYMESAANSLIGFESFDLNEAVRREAVRDGDPDDPSHWGLTSSLNPIELIGSMIDQVQSMTRFTFKLGVALIDEWLYTLVLLGRYVWLVLLEITAPIAILVKFMSDETNDYKQFFTGWLRNMYNCYMLLIGFMVANTLALYISDILWEDHETDNVITILFVLAIKIFLYGAAGRHSQKLI